MDGTNFNFPKKSNTKKIALISFAVVLAASLAGFASWAYIDSQSARNELASLNKELVTSKATTNKLRVDAAKAADVTDQKPADTTVVKDEDAVIAATKAHAHAPKAAEKVAVTVTVAKLEASFARASVSTDGEIGGYSCTLKKVDGIWLVLFCGQSAPLQDELDKYGVPASVVPS